MSTFLCVCVWDESDVAVLDECEGTWKWELRGALNETHAAATPLS